MPTRLLPELSRIVRAVAQLGESERIEISKEGIRVTAEERVAEVLNVTQEKFQARIAEDKKRRITRREACCIDRET